MSDPYGELIRIAAVLARREIVPDLSEHPWQATTGVRERSSLLRKMRDADDRCGALAQKLADAAKAMRAAHQPSVCPHGYPKHADPHWVNACCVADPTTQPSDARCPVIDAPHVFEGGKCRHCRIADPTSERR